MTTTAWFILLKFRHAGKRITAYRHWCGGRPTLVNKGHCADTAIIFYIQHIDANGVAHLSSRHGKPANNINATLSFVHWLRKWHSTSIRSTIRTHELSSGITPTECLVMRSEVVVRLIFLWGFSKASRTTILVVGKIVQHTLKYRTLRWLMKNFESIPEISEISTQERSLKRLHHIAWKPCCSGRAWNKEQQKLQTKNFLYSSELK